MKNIHRLLVIGAVFLGWILPAKSIPNAAYNESYWKEAAKALRLADHELAKAEKGFLTYKQLVKGCILWHLMKEPYSLGGLARAAAYGCEEAISRLAFVHRHGFFGLHDNLALQVKVLERLRCYANQGSQAAEHYLLELDEHSPGEQVENEKEPLCR